jgi:hypothetical protein
MSVGSSYITLGYNFLQLTINSIEEMEKQGNHHTILSKGHSSEKESWDNYEEKTKWNDNNIALPVLFNFYHGIELIIKGLILELTSLKLQKKHTLTILLSTFEKSENALEHNLQTVLKEILQYDPNGIFKRNDTSIDRYHVLLRYPEIEVKYVDQTVNSYMLKSQGVAGLATFTEVKNYAIRTKTCIKNWLVLSNNKSV